MLVNRTAPAGIALALSGCLALGSAGTAFAAGTENRPDTAATAEQPVTAAQFRVVEHLGELTRLTGTLGRLVQDSTADAQLVKSLQRQLRVEIRAVQKAVTRTHMNRPAVPPGDSRPARLAAAVTQFEAAVDAAAVVDRTSQDARAKAAADLLTGLTKLNRAAAAQAGIPERLLIP